MGIERNITVALAAFCLAAPPMKWPLVAGAVAEQAHTEVEQPFDPITPAVLIDAVVATATTATAAPIFLVGGSSLPIA